MSALPKKNDSKMTWSGICVCVCVCEYAGHNGGLYPCVMQNRRNTLNRWNRDREVLQGSVSHTTSPRRRLKIALFLIVVHFKGLQECHTVLNKTYALIWPGAACDVLFSVARSHPWGPFTHPQRDANPGGDTRAAQEDLILTEN